MNILAAQDKLWQSLGAVERKLEGLHDAMALFSENEDKLTLKLDAGLKGTADGVALAIAEHCARSFWAHPQRGCKHSYRGKRRKS